MPAFSDHTKYTTALDTKFPCNAWVVAILAGLVWNCSKGRLDRRRFVLLMLHGAEDCSQTELHVVSFEGVKLKSVTPFDERIPAKDAHTDARKALYLPGPSAFTNACQTLTRNANNALAPVPAPAPAEEYAGLTDLTGGTVAGDSSASRVQTRRGGAAALTPAPAALAAAPAAAPAPSGGTGAGAPSNAHWLRPEQTSLQGACASAIACTHAKPVTRHQV
eukprot:4969970-Pleurochrysis_carterae.AAC.1